MSRFTGRQVKGAMAIHRKRKRTEAEARNAASKARLRECGHIHGERVPCES